MSGFWFPFFDRQDWDDFDDDKEPAPAEPPVPQHHISDKTVLQYGKCLECDSFVGYCLWSEGLEFPPCFLEARGGGKNGSNKRAA